MVQNIELTHVRRQEELHVLLVQVLSLPMIAEDVIVDVPME